MLRRKKPLPNRLFHPVTGLVRTKGCSAESSSPTFSEAPRGPWLILKPWRAAAAVNSGDEAWPTSESAIDWNCGESKSYARVGRRALAPPQLGEELAVDHADLVVPVALAIV